MSKHPAMIQLNLAGIPTALTQLDQWVLWRWEFVDGRWTKVPIDCRTGKRASTTNPNTWSAFTAALHFLENRKDDVHGLGFVFAEDDPFFGIDLDKARDPETGKLTPEAQAIVDRFDTFTEWSITGTGAHIIGRGSLKVKGNRKPRLGLEVYDHDRFFVMSGHTIINPGLIGDRSEELDLWHREIWPEHYTATDKPTVAQPETPISADDKTILDRAFSARNGAKVKALFDGDISGYPSGSEADEALASFFTFWSTDYDQVLRLIEASALWDDKWQRPDYQKRTINRALNRSDFYDWNRSIVTIKRGGSAHVVTDDDLPDDVPTLKAMIRELQANTANSAELERVKTELADLKILHSNMVRTFLSPHLVQSEKIALVASTNLAAKKRELGDVRPDGSIEITAGEVANDFRPAPMPGEPTPSVNRDGTVPRMPRKHVKTAMESLASRGIIPATPRQVTIPRAHGKSYKDTVWDINLTEKPADILAFAATWKPDEPKQRKPRSASVPCPSCGEVHPIRRQDVCMGCGEILRVVEIQPDTVPDGENVTITPDLEYQPAIVTKNRRHIDSVVLPLVTKNRQQGNDQTYLAAEPSSSLPTQKDAPF